MRWRDGRQSWRVGGGVRKKERQEKGLEKRPAETGGRERGRGIGGCSVCIGGEREVIGGGRKGARDRIQTGKLGREVD